MILKKLKIVLLKLTILILIIILLIIVKKLLLIILMVTNGQNLKSKILNFTPTILKKSLIFLILNP